MRSPKRATKPLTGGPRMKLICPKCSRERPAICVQSDGCDVCKTERQREADRAAHEARAPKAVNGVVTQGPSDEEIEEVRDRLLDRSGWSQLPDRRTKIGAGKAKEWDDYRAAVDKEAKDARTQKRPPAWPEPPAR